MAAGRPSGSGKTVVPKVSRGHVLLKLNTLLVYQLSVLHLFFYLASCKHSLSAHIAPSIHGYTCKASEGAFLPIHSPQPLRVMI